MPENEPVSCDSCGTSEVGMPLVAVRFSGRNVWICPQCMPELIHQTKEVIAKLEKPGAR